MGKSQRFLQLIVWLMVVSFITKSNAQSGKLPPFRMVQTNGKVFGAESLPMGKPIVLVYFDPTCDHCNTLMKNMLVKQKELAKASVALVTYVSVAEVKKFAEQHQLSRFANMYIGTESTTFFLKNYYKLVHMPFLALYTKMGDVVNTWPDETGLADLLNRLSQLK